MRRDSVLSQKKILEICPCLLSTPVKIEFEFRPVRENYLRWPAFFRNPRKTNDLKRNSSFHLACRLLQVARAVHEPSKRESEGRAPS